MKDAIPLVAPWVDTKADLPQGERAAVHLIVGMGVAYGFGNLIAHLQRAWAAELVNRHDMTREQALRGATATQPYTL